MSRSCCPREAEGMAWGRGRWGCMAPARKNKQRQQGGQSITRNSQRGLTNEIRLGLCNSWGLLRIPGTVSSSTYNLLYKVQATSVHILLFLDCSLLSNIRWLIKGLVYLCCALFPLCCIVPHTQTLPLGSNNPWISPLLLQAGLFTNRIVPVAPIKPPYYIPLFVQDSMWQASSSVCVCVLCCFIFHQRFFLCVLWWKYERNLANLSSKGINTEAKHTLIKRQTHKERWMIYVFIYAIYFFSDTGVNQHVSLKTKQKKVIKQTYKVKINICAHSLKVTFGFQRHKLKSTTASSTLSPSPTTNKQGFFLFLLKGFSCNKRHLWWNDGNMGRVH